MDQGAGSRAHPGNHLAPAARAGARRREWRRRSSPGARLHQSDAGAARHADSKISQSGKYQYDCGGRRGGKILRRVRRMGQRTNGLEQRQPAHRGGLARMRIVDPTDERVPIRRTLAKRSGTITGSVALLDISKPRGDVLIDQLAARLREEMPGVEIRRYKKPTFTKPAPEELRRQIAKENDFVIEALAD